MVNTTLSSLDPNVPHPDYVDKLVEHYTIIIDNHALDHIMKILSKTTYSKVKGYTNLAKELLDKLIELYMGTEGIRENKLNVVMQQFNSFKLIRVNSIEKLKPTLLKFWMSCLFYKRKFPKESST